MREFTSRGYAVFSMTDRGFHESCGSPASITAGGSACDNGYIHLMDDRYEVRDAQFFAGELADEGLVNGQKVGATGGSYGGGLSLALATLKDRTMLPNGSLVPWTSPVNGIPMRIAAATPVVPWSDLAYSLTPNGGTLDYVADSLHRPDRDREGVIPDRPLPVRARRARPLLRRGAVPLAVHELRRGRDVLEGPAGRGRALRRRSDA